MKVLVACAVLLPGCASAVVNLREARVMSLAIGPPPYDVCQGEAIPVHVEAALEGGGRASTIGAPRIAWTDLQVEAERAAFAVREEGAAARVVDDGESLLAGPVVVRARVRDTDVATGVTYPIRWSCDLVADFRGPPGAAGAAGRPGFHRRTPGAHGEAGQEGDVGGRGGDAPDLAVSVRRVDGPTGEALLFIRILAGGESDARTYVIDPGAGSLRIRAAGGAGGQGGPGGIGGDGGRVDRNERYRYTDPFLRDGHGGRGGSGGSGGDGGRGGAVVVEVSADAARFLPSITVDNRGGPGGPGGAGGRGGALPGGADGAAGRAGSPGADGPIPEFIVAEGHPDTGARSSAPDRSSSGGAVERDPPVLNPR
jgi:hypothetical protein